MFEYRELLINLILKDLKVRYRGAILGYAWSVLNPVIRMLIFTAIFSYIVRIEVENYSLFLLCALFPWNFFAITLTNASSSIVDNFSLINKVYFPREIFPVSIVFSNFVHLIISLSIMIAFLFFTSSRLSLSVLTLPVVILAHVIFTIGFSLILSSVTVFFRDMKYILEPFLMVWFYSTPIIYPLSMVPERVKIFFYLNPMVSIISFYRSILLNGETPAISTLIFIFAVSFIVLFIGYYVFQKYDPLIPKTL